MSGMCIALISSYAVCVACLLILLWGLLAHRTEKNFSTNAYIVCLVACIIGIVTDALSYILEGQQGIDSLLIILNTCALADYGIISAALMYYMWDLLNNKSHVSIMYVHIGAIICAVDIMFYILGSIFGFIFTVENGRYVYYPLARVGQIVEVALMLYFVIFSLMKGRKAGAKILIAIITYILLPLLSVIAYAIADEVSFSYVAIVLVLLIVYVMIQADEQEKMVVRESVMLEVSNTDTMTGLQNRRAYNTRLTELAEAETVGVLFCDLNGLKAVNDTEGHIAGDKYIVTFSNLLRQNFQEKEIFRISGDEFVILLEETTTEKLQQITELVRKVFAENDNIASVGAALGAGESLSETISAAENEMYADKKNYYVSGGKERKSTVSFDTGAML